jgi:hypothetical protein
LSGVKPVASLPDTSSGTCRRPSAVNCILSPQTHADDRRQKMMGKKRTENLLLFGRTRRPAPVGVRRRLIAFFYRRLTQINADNRYWEKKMI